MKRLNLFRGFSNQGHPHKRVVIKGKVSFYECPQYPPTHAPTYTTKDISLSCFIPQQQQKQQLRYVLHNSVSNINLVYESSS